MKRVLHIRFMKLQINEKLFPIELKDALCVTNYNVS